MSGVVLRCPNCGTTKAVPGECEACHEAQVRHFCTNHTPGLWLDAPACPRCGARLGGPARSPAAPPLRPGPARAPAPASTSQPRATTGSIPPRRETAGGLWGRGRRERVPAPEEVGGARVGGAAGRDALMARLPKLLKAVSRVRRVPASATYAPEEAPATGPALGGCLSRALFLAVFLLIALATMFVMVGGSLFQIFGIYY